MLEASAQVINLKPKDDRHRLDNPLPARPTLKEVTEASYAVPVLQIGREAPIIHNATAAPTQREGLVEAIYTGAPQGSAQGSALPAEYRGTADPTMRETTEHGAHVGVAGSAVGVPGNVATFVEARETIREETGSAPPILIPTSGSLSAPMDRTAAENYLTDGKREASLLNRMPGPAVHNTPTSHYVNVKLRSDQPSVDRMGPVNLSNLYSERMVGSTRAPSNRYENSLVNHQIDPMLVEQRLSNPYATSILTAFNMVTTDPFQC